MVIVHYNSFLHHRYPVFRNGDYIVHTSEPAVAWYLVKQSPILFLIVLTRSSEKAEKNSIFIKNINITQ